MASWDVFRADRLEVERGLSTEALRAALAGGDVRPDDLVRPAGSSEPWARIADAPGLLPAPPGAAAEPEEDAGAFPPTPADASPETREYDGSTRSYHEGDDPAPFPLLGSPPGPRVPDPPPTSPSPAAGGVEDRDDHDHGPLSRSDFEDDDLVELNLTADAPAIEVGPHPTVDDPGGWSRSTFELTEDDDVEAPSDAFFAEADADADAEADEADPVPPVDSDLVIDHEGQPTVEIRRPPGPDPDGPEPEPDDWDALVAAAGVVPPAPGLRVPVTEAAPPAFADPRPPDAPDDPFGDEDDEHDDEHGAFSLAPAHEEHHEELDMTAMADVAFQLVTFFLITATILYFKTIEIPTPEPDDGRGVAQQMRTLDELTADYILVEIDPQGRIAVDREPVAVDQLSARLRQVRTDTLRTGMLVMADFATPHRSVVLAIDAANAVGLEIAIARPSGPPE